MCPRRVETVRKPTTGLKRVEDIQTRANRRGRDGQKTHDGIETVHKQWRRAGTRNVETVRKPTTGLKHNVVVDDTEDSAVETVRKPTTGLKRKWRTLC